MLTPTALPLTTRHNRVVANGSEDDDGRARFVGAGSARFGFCHRQAGGFVVDERAAVGEGGDEGLAGQVVDRWWQAPGSLVQAGDGVARNRPPLTRSRPRCRVAPPTSDGSSGHRSSLRWWHPESAAARRDGW